MNNSFWFLIYFKIGILFLISFQINGFEENIIGIDDKEPKAEDRIEQVEENLSQIEQIIDADEKQIFGKIDEFLANKTKMCELNVADESVEKEKMPNENEILLPEIMEKICKSPEEGNEEILKEIFVEKFDNFFGEIKKLENSEKSKKNAVKNNRNNLRENILISFKKIEAKFRQKYEGFFKNGQFQIFKEIVNWLQESVEQLLEGKNSVMEPPSGFFSKLRNLYEFWIQRGFLCRKQNPNRIKRHSNPSNRNLRHKNQKKKKRKMLKMRALERRRRRFFIICTFFATTLLCTFMDFLALESLIVNVPNLLTKLITRLGTQLVYTMFKKYGPF